MDVKYIGYIPDHVFSCTCLAAFAALTYQRSALPVYPQFWSCSQLRKKPTLELDKNQLICKSQISC